MVSVCEAACGSLTTDKCQAAGPQPVSTASNGIWKYEGNV